MGTILSLQGLDLLNQFKGAKYFSKINLSSTYQKVPIEKTNVWQTTFKSIKGLFEWMVIPFNLTNYSRNFMKTMDDILWPFTTFLWFYIWMTSSYSTKIMYNICSTFNKFSTPNDIISYFLIYKNYHLACR